MQLAGDLGVWAISEKSGGLCFVLKRELKTTKIIIIGVVALQKVM